MTSALPALVERLSQIRLLKANIIPWSSPIPSFGDLSRARVATLGLNPSNREFVDNSGNELVDTARRFHTLRSLGLARWCDIKARHLRLIWDSCRTYFSRNPYDAWFKQLEHLIGETRTSYYNGSEAACHVDLIPYATACKWTGLSHHQRSYLFYQAGDTLGLLLRDSPVQLLILNGSSVVANFEKIAGIQLDRQIMHDWMLRRHSHSNIMGVAYAGTVHELSGIKLKRGLMVLGFNHNIQSSFGVTREVRASIRKWIGQNANELWS